MNQSITLSCAVSPSYRRTLRFDFSHCSGLFPDMS